MRVAALLLMVGMAVTASAEPVMVSLRTELDSRWSRAGDPVSAKLEAPLQAGSLLLPKGTVLLGRVQGVTKKNARGHAEIGVVFDRVALESGGTRGISATIVAVTAAPQEQIPECDSPALPEESNVQVMSRNCKAPRLYRSVHRQDGASGTLLKDAPERGPWRESWLAGPLTLQKGTRMNVEIVPAG